MTARQTDGMDFSTRVLYDVSMVVNFIRETPAIGKCCEVILVDVKNAFNLFN